MNKTPYVDITKDMKAFYRNLTVADFTKIKTEKLRELKMTSIILNEFYNNAELEPRKKIRYSRIANMLRTNPKRYGINNSAEMYILFMFSVDPNYEAAIIYGESNNTTDVKEKMANSFGHFDSKLIKLEKYFIKNFLCTRKKEEIKEEIKKRVFK